MRQAHNQLVIRYEDLTSDLDNQFTKLLAFMGVQANDRILNAARDIGKKRYVNLSTLTEDAVHFTREQAQQLAASIPECREAMHRFGYPIRKP